jgi:hypothetical protein
MASVSGLEKTGFVENTSPVGFLGCIGLLEFIQFYYRKLSHIGYIAVIKYSSN